MTAGMIRLFAVVVLFQVSNSVSAQSISDPLLFDALRYNAPVRGAGSVGIGMGYATVTSNQDPMAWMINPANLGLFRSTTVDFGIRVRHSNTSSAFMSNTTETSNSGTDIDHFSLIYSMPVEQGSFVVALAYGQFNLFDYSATGSQQNDKSSYVEGFAGFNPFLRFASEAAAISAIEDLQIDDVYFDMAVQAGLFYAVKDPSNPALWRIRAGAIGHVLQQYEALYDGSLYAWSAGLASEVSKGVFLGGSIQVLGGFYLKDYQYSETGDPDFYRQFPDSGLYDPQDRIRRTFVSLNQSESQDDDISGYALRLGGLVTISDELRIAVAYAPPTILSVDSRAEWDLTAVWENSTGTSRQLFGAAEPLSLPVQYDLEGPGIFDVSAGYQSFPLSGEVGLTWTDYSAMKFSSTTDEDYFASLNREIKLSMSQTIDYKAGIQYALPAFQSFLRAGFLTAEDPLGGDRRNFYSLGYEFVAESGYRFVASWQRTSVKQSYVSYLPVGKDPVGYTEEESLNTFSISTIIRF